MNAFLNNRRRAGNFLRRLFGAALLVWMVGVPYAKAAVTIDQQPLIIQVPLPPNMVLMLDDSGSMAWDYMPDWGYLQNHSNNDALIDAANNGAYYDPTVTYLPPVQADGTPYAASPGLTAAPVDGFATSPSPVDLTTYYYSSRDSARIHYSAAAGTLNTTKTSVDYDQCRQNVYDKWSVLYGWNYDWGTYTCTIQWYSNITATYFQYSTGPAGGPYSVHYVADKDCGSLNTTTTPSCVLASDTSGVAAPKGVAAGQNIANWYSYYHTRILMAKSGLMNAFANIDPTFRIGFGSINGRNNSNLPSLTSTYNNKVIADVQPFGDGTSGTQKAAFWNWLVGIHPGNSTPLRLSLDAVGQYYQSQQPWLTDTSDTSSGELACRQSYTILTTDGFWNGGSPSVGNVDGVDGSAISGPNGQNYTYKAAPPYSDSNSDTLADVAMKYWMTDLRGNVANEVTPAKDDPAFWQHMTTFTLGLGFAPLYSDHSTPIPMDQVFAWANGGTAISGFQWPTPTSNSVNNIADLAHAAVNGHGGFYSAKTPQAFSSSIKEALKRASERVGTGASLAANSTELKTGTVAYQANYYTVKWKGDLKALAVDPNTGAIATSPTWRAADLMPAAANRNIWTYNPSGKNANQQFIQFTDPTTLAPTEAAALGSNTVNQQNMIDYLRGDASLEQKNGGSYRNRDTSLGDIVDSQPVYVGAPDPNQFYTENFTGAADYATFATNQSTRQALIYVAANDGMVHAFNADTGVEAFAYMPAAVIDAGVSALADPNYGTYASPHQFFNDGELTVSDVYFNKAWHTVMVGTTGRGSAKAVYALDVTDPSSIQLLWERSAADGRTNSGYIGQMSGKPVIAQTADGSWSVLIGNGYNSAQGVAALLQFSIADGSLTVHKTTDTTTDNGLAAPAVWIDDPSNGISTVAYAGDLHGHVWSFPLYSGGVAQPSSTGTLLFTAKDSGGKVQPITGGMLAGKDPSTSNVWVFFGTGRYLSSADLQDNSVQTWYGLIVQSPSDSTLVSNLANGRSSLVQRQIVAETAGNPAASPPVLPARVVTPMPTPSDMTGKSGWYMDLLSPLATTPQGERMVTPNQFQGNLLLGTTRIPEAKDLCNPSGSGWIMAVDPFTGTNPVSDFFDTNGDGVIDSKDTVTVNGKSYPAAGVSFTSLPNNPIFVGGSMLVSFDNGTTGSLTTSGSSGGIKRVSWRELVNQ